MKELTIQQKAERYDEAIERARIWKDKSGMPKDKQGILDDIFPELKESEDERIRKEIVSAVNSYCSEYLIGTKVRNDMLAWLEKQGGQKSAYNLEPKFKVGDSIKTANEEPLTITEITDNGYWSEDLFICGFDDTVKWELVEQKPTWSEEDKKMLNSIIDDIENIKSMITNEQLVDILNKEIDWLKNLRPQNQWKPTEEQINALEWQVNHTSDGLWQYKATKELLEQLKQI